ncbi:MAG TPA: glycosyltransferase family 2 protein [Verrucomicrobiae bacterium]
MEKTAVTKLPISVCMISGAESHRIGKALASVAEWAGEIIVVLNKDAADGTDKAAAAFGAKIFREPWRGFIAQKNSAAAKASFPWILGLDADEVISPALREKIAARFEAGRAPSEAAFKCPRCTFYCGRWIRHGDWYPDYVTRLWRKDAAEWTGVEPHAGLAARGSVGTLAADMFHYSNDSIDQQISKIAPYSADFVRHRRQNNKSAGMADLTIRPAWRFFRAYVLRRGFLDGWQGFYIASLTAFSTLTRYVKVLEAEKKSSGP